MKKPDGQTVFLGSAIMIAITAVILLFVFSPGKDGQAENLRRSQLSLDDIPFDGRRSYEWLQRICELGPRYSGSRGMLQQQEMLKQHFEQLGGLVELQQFQVRHPLNGSPVSMANLIVRWHPDRKERILLCAHYDTRPFPDRDPDPTPAPGAVHRRQ